MAGPQNNAATVAFVLAAGQAQVYRATVSMGAIKNTIALETAPGDKADVSARLARMPMTAPDSQA